MEKAVVPIESQSTSPGMQSNLRSWLNNRSVVTHILGAHLFVIFPLYHLPSLKNLLLGNSAPSCIFTQMIYLAISRPARHNAWLQPKRMKQSEKNYSIYFEDSSDQIHQLHTGQVRKKDKQRSDATTHSRRHRRAFQGTRRSNIIQSSQVNFPKSGSPSPESAGPTPAEKESGGAQKGG